jgi:DNA-binding response OmpR family regulator
MVLADQNGLDLCRSIRSLTGPSAPPVLILCGRCRRGDPDRAHMAGADAFQTLPFDERAVVDWLRSLGLTPLTDDGESRD